MDVALSFEITYLRREPILFLGLKTAWAFCLLSVTPFILFYSQHTEEPKNDELIKKSKRVLNLN